MTKLAIRLSLSLALATCATAALAQPAQPGPGGAPGAGTPGGGAAPRRKRQPPPPVIPLEETGVAQRQYNSGNYQGAVQQAKLALNKNERFTPAMLVMAKSYYQMGKYEWVRTLWTMMQAAGASDAEKAEMFQILAFMEHEKQNTPQAIELLKKATDARPENAKMWNNLGAEFLLAKNYREAAPALEKAVQLQPTFAKAHLNLGSAYRGLKDYERAQSAYQKALQLFPNYADAVFNLGILYLDAEKMPNMDTTAKLNTAIGYLQKYRTMLTSAGLPVPKEADGYVAEAQASITKEQKRIERQRKQEERDRQRGAQKTAQPAAAAPGAPAPAAPAAPPR